MMSGIPIDILFIASVLLIWFMLMYQFVLAFAGYLYSRESNQERALLDAQPREVPALTILIPAHNEEMVIERTLHTLLESDYPKEKLEIIVLNDGSTDNTPTLLENLARQYPMIRPVHIPEGEGGKGKAAVLNRGVGLASHPFVAIFDADNQPEPSSLRYLASQFVMDPTLGAALGKFRTLNRNRNWLTRFINIEGLSFQWIVQAGRWKLLKIATLPGTNFIVRRTVLDEVGPWDEEALTEDAELSLRILEAGHRIKFVPYAVTWEQEPENLSTWFQQRTRWARGNFYLMRKFMAGISTAKNKALAMEVFYFLCLYYVFVAAIVTSALLFFLGLFGMIFIPVPGPYLEVWLMAYLLFVTEVVLMLSREEGEDSVSNILFTMLMYFTYCQLWPLVVAKAFYLEYIRKGARTWSKTKRFAQLP